MNKNMQKILELAVKTSTRTKVIVGLAIGAVGVALVIGTTLIGAPSISSLTVGTWGSGGIIQPYQCEQTKYCMIDVFVSNPSTGYVADFYLRNSAGTIIATLAKDVSLAYSNISAGWMVSAGTALANYTVIGKVRKVGGVVSSSKISNVFAVIAPIPVSGISVAVSPSSAAVQVSKTQQFTATVSNTSNTAVTWSMVSGNGAINSSGLYTAPSVPTTATIKAVSQADSTKYGSATVTVTTEPPPPPPPEQVSISVSPSSVIVQVFKTQQFTAAVSGTSNTSVTWKIDSPLTGGGAISSAGLYTAPSAVPSSGSRVVIRATSQADTTKFATANIDVSAVGIPSVASLTVKSSTGLVGACVKKQNCVISWTLNSPASGYSLTLQIKNSAGTVVQSYTGIYASTYSGSKTWTIPYTDKSGSHQVVATIKNSSGVAQPNPYTVNFSVNPPAPLTGNTSTRVKVVSPNGGNSFNRGSILTVNWSSQISIPSTYYGQAALFKSGTLVNGSCSNSFTYATCSFTLPSALVADNDYQIRVRETQYSTYDFSDSYFSIY